MRIKRGHCCLTITLNGPENSLHVVLRVFIKKSIDMGTGIIKEMWIMRKRIYCLIQADDGSAHIIFLDQNNIFDNAGHIAWFFLYTLLELMLDYNICRYMFEYMPCF
jgi:hypothetical protein